MPLAGRWVPPDAAEGPAGDAGEGPSGVFPPVRLRKVTDAPCQVPVCTIDEGSMATAALAYPLWMGYGSLMAKEPNLPKLDQSR